MLPTHRTRLPDCRVSSWARIGADWQRPVWKLPLRLSSNHLAAAGTLEVVPGTSLGVVTVTSLSVKDRPIAVYNLEVHGEHVYRVSKLGILVHNACSPSKILGRAMAGGDEALAASISAAGNQAAHVVPVRGFSRRAADVVKACNDARAILNRPGIKIDINDAWNGFWTNSSRHLGSHTDAYLLEMGRLLRKAEPKGQTAVVDALDELKGLLMSGAF